MTATCRTAWIWDPWWRSIRRPWPAARPRSLCVAQLSSGDGNAHVVQLRRPAYDAPNLKRLLTDPKVLKLFHFGRFDIAMFALHLGVVDRAGLLHQDRLQAGAHLYRPPRPEGPHPRVADRGDFQGAAVVRLGPGHPDPRPDRLRRLRRPLPARPEGPARRHARARRPRGPGPGLLRLPADPRPARPGGVGRTSMSSPTADPATCAPPRRALAAADILRRRKTPEQLEAPLALVRAMRVILPVLWVAIVAGLAMMAGINTWLSRTAAAPPPAAGASPAQVPLPGAQRFRPALPDHRRTAPCATTSTPRG